MIRTTTFSWLICSCLALAFAACDTPDTAFSDQSGKLRLVFDNVVGTSDLKLTNNNYQNASGESFTITKFNYYVSNIRLRKSDGTDYVVPQDSSYFLVEESRPASQTVTLNNLPVGNYTGISFMIGVDSLRSLADISKRTGVLDPGIATHDPMYWDWNSGYIFVKLEGISKAVPDTQNNQFFYHIGGFGGGYNGKKTINNLRTVTLPFRSDVISVGSASTPTVQLTTDVLKLFDGSTKLSIARYPSVMFETYSTSIADNYAQMIRYERMQAN
ncbi:hypothetical protein IC229_20385 [Spirosoma sp. BT702]|uniref:Copper-binding protein MbnP-like domain-containing protein n=1 Tax=Spirosoma profusum TaxID=2771354 RepID=A0A927ARY5_9BACT|nr:MbnP family protein [Spirosoma profusum]MBD2703016.1 hypothetical protein [Spirosoma profusum]